jgi:hypothetical protein
MTDVTLMNVNLIYIEIPNLGHVSHLYRANCTTDVTLHTQKIFYPVF